MGPVSSSSFSIFLRWISSLFAISTYSADFGCSSVQHLTVLWKAGCKEWKWWYFATLTVLSSQLIWPDSIHVQMPCLTPLDILVSIWYDVEEFHHQVWSGLVYKTSDFLSQYSCLIRSTEIKESVKRRADANKAQACKREFDITHKHLSYSTPIVKETSFEIRNQVS